MEDPILKKEIPVLVYANKADSKGTATPEEIKGILKLDEIKFPFKIVKASVVTGEGLEEGISWLAKVIKVRMEKEKS